MKYEVMIAVKLPDGRYGIKNDAVDKELTEDEIRYLDHKLELNGFVCIPLKNVSIPYFNREDNDYSYQDCILVNRFADDKMMLVGHNHEVFEMAGERVIADTVIVKTKKGYYVVKLK